MMIAAMIAMNAVAPSFGDDWNISPPSSTVTPLPRAATASFSTGFVVRPRMLLPRCAKSTVAYATVPSFEIWWAPAAA